MDFNLLAFCLGHTDTDRLTHGRRHTGHARRTGEGQRASTVADRKYMTEREQRQEHTATTEMRGRYTTDIRTDTRGRHTGWTLHALLKSCRYIVRRYTRELRVADLHCDTV